ncbi:hypothetical protein OCH239_15735 [Roseivivax halodurans JCM 10272]|uniref:Uncharacterized protein n=1 Tax=Roseivivax halodurans JCM 10272 TaxID=1449350 RepID=X7ECJ6_9RHOB|nr:hypothetical protein [Roseivivax halodurans]ETX12838.1 hypothetical protein OCH239_15735 [Roseivivax halodurans JCM 10272]
MTPAIKWAITLLMGVTIFRAQTILFLPEVQIFGGSAPDGWFGPWLSDTIIGFAVPVMLYLFWTRRSVAMWGALVSYNAVGAFDYSQGLITQAISPMPAEMASATAVYLGIGLFMVAQLLTLGLLFRRDVIADFRGAVARSAGPA